MTENKPVTPERIMQFAWGYAPTLAIEAAVRHKVFDILDKNPRTISQLAAETGASERGLTAVLNLLVALQLLGRDGERYTLTPESATWFRPNRLTTGHFLRMSATTCFRAGCSFQRSCERANRQRK